MLVSRLSPQEYEKAQYRDLGPVAMLRVAGLAVHGSCTETSHTVCAAWVTILVGLPSLPELIRLSCRNTRRQDWKRCYQRDSSIPK
jgi:hypothetical protein